MRHADKHPHSPRPQKEASFSQSNSGKQVLHRNVKRFRGGLVFKAHILCPSLNSRLESNKEEEEESKSDWGRGGPRRRCGGRRCTSRTKQSPPVAFAGTGSWDRFIGQIHWIYSLDRFIGHVHWTDKLATDALGRQRPLLPSGSASSEIFQYILQSFSAVT